MNFCVIINLKRGNYGEWLVIECLAVLFKFNSQAAGTDTVNMV